jgi:hypothetical protein
VLRARRVERTKQIMVRHSAQGDTAAITADAPVPIIARPEGPDPTLDRLVAAALDLGQVQQARRLVAEAEPGDVRIKFADEENGPHGWFENSACWHEVEHLERAIGIAKPNAGVSRSDDEQQ